MVASRGGGRVNQQLQYEEPTGPAQGDDDRLRAGDEDLRLSRRPRATGNFAGKSREKNITKLPVKSLCWDEVNMQEHHDNPFKYCTGLYT
jgi:hypothetical protein